MKPAPPLRVVLLALGALLAAAGPAPGGDVVHSPHNLSASGGGGLHDLKAPEEKRVCIFCHTPHHATHVTPLWSRELSTRVYDLYRSSTLKAAPGQPTGASRLCLSCHDGTIALGQLNGSYTISTLGPIPPGPTNLDDPEHSLRDDHPISFAYTPDLALGNELADPSLLPARGIKLEGGRLECTACHDPHDNRYGRFLVMDDTDSRLCIQCHEKTGWDQSLHPHPQDALAAPVFCEACHAPHNADQPVRLLRGVTEQATCLARCHNGSGNGTDVSGLFGAAVASSHPLDYAEGIHDAAEDPLAAPKHVECADCHNGHRVKDQAAVPPAVEGALVGVSGVDITGSVVAEASREYEVCFRCHADNSFVSSTAVPRALQEVNERLRFDPANPSYHPVAAMGRGTNVPSLRPEYTTSSLIYCTDCHNSDQSAKAGGAGPDGPHGSNFRHILIARYEADTYPLPYSEGDYALCFRCHDPAVLLGPGSAFPKHGLHVVSRGVPCSVCHDPHGVPVADGATPRANAHLVNFDTRFVPFGTYDAQARSCTVSCHGTKSY
ncbi:cytochrome C [Dissulfurirhabdus thermomarina]|uniref:Cytochrome C n=1 Tax=Dissulfurirhabdus thermomarina TaxID=1765737 RepID=A0A6N9TK08_DISTH|nr:cytochrome c3 family protein [Dissulfurirhabdus thermomarina]NDY41418.1 cytochrome C [Dissulfurirhabdus thermomarina]NMX24406.1 cytochrome C [Dissulfurirhabdus thermomarina]